jgi:hypothetical protein
VYIGWGVWGSYSQVYEVRERADETGRGKYLLVVKGVWRLKRNP